MHAVVNKCNVPVNIPCILSIADRVSSGLSIGTLALLLDTVKSKKLCKYVISSNAYRDTISQRE